MSTRLASPSRLMHSVYVEAELREVTATDGLDLHFQPIVSLPDGAIVRVEALARWQRENGEWVPPCDFIPLADRTGLIVPLGQQVLERACRSAATWRAAGQPVGVSVNVSARQLDEPDFPDHVVDTLGRHRLPGHALWLEITESAIVHDPAHTAPILAGLRQRGVRVALDDYGTGSSSLTLLRDLPVDVLKIDKSFVDRVADQPRDAVLVRMLTDGAHALGLSVCAEGVESLQQGRQLTALGVEHAQGWAFGRALPVTGAGHLPVADWPLPAVDVRSEPSLPLGAAEDIVVVTDARGVVVYASPTAGDRLGVSPSSVVGVPATDFVHPDDRDKVRTLSGQGTVRVSGGSTVGWRSWDIFSRTQRTGGGHPAVATGAETLWLCRDVTDALAAAATAHEQQELFRLSFYDSPVGMAISSLDGTMVQVNDAFADLMRVPRDRLVGTTVSSWTHPDDRPADRRNVGELLSGSAMSHTVDKRIVLGDGSVLSVSVQATVVVNAEGPRWVVAHVVPRP